MYPPLFGEIFFLNMEVVFAIEVGNMYLGRGRLSVTIFGYVEEVRVCGNGFTLKIGN